jgi:cation:H+ antiporter
MDLALNILSLIVAAVGLWWGAIWIVESAARIAKRLGISELVVGLTIVAFGTSAPEFAVTLNAALRGQADISVGNVVGSNIFNLGFILGGVALFRAIRTTPPLIYRDGAALIGTSLLLLVLLSDLSLARWEGALLMTLLLAYLFVLFRNRGPLEDEVPTGIMRWHDVPRLVVGLAVVIGCGQLLVESASHLARTIGISEWVIGVTVVAAGTSVPELATSLVAVTRKHYGISAGNLIGSDLFNLLGVLGFATVLRPMTVDSAAFGSLLMLCGLVVLVVVMLRSGWQLSRFEGGILVGLNLVRWVLDFASKGHAS